jgi:hypothetical protein
MRTFIDGDGDDSTTAVLAALQAGVEFRFADLYLIGEQDDPFATFMTNWETPLTWSPWGVYNPAALKRGRISSKAGLEVMTLDVEFSPAMTAFGTTIATANPYQKAWTGFYDNKTFRLWRCLMNTPGDANTYGACDYFGGRVSKTKVQRGKITISVNSFLEVVNQQVPPNVIEMNNTLANFAGNVPVVSDGETQVAEFTIATVIPIPQGGTNNSFWATCTAPTPNKIYGTNKFQYGFMVFNPGTSLAGYFAVVALSGSNQIGGTGPHYNQFITYQSFPWPPQIGDSFYVATKPPISLQDAVAGFEYFGFPYVPQPETSA